MELNEKKQWALAEQGIDPDEVKKPRQTLPPLSARISKLKRYLAATDKKHPKYQTWKNKLDLLLTVQKNAED